LVLEEEKVICISLHAGIFVGVNRDSAIRPVLRALRILNIKLPPTMDINKYGSISKRARAILIDGLIMLGLGLVASLIISKFNNVPDFVRAIAFILVFFLYDPLFTSLIGATIGHMIIGLKVRQEKDETKRIIFPLALVRYIVKVVLGWASLLSISDDNKRMALHDSLVKSVVLQS
jgi:uncharacterized RDD family membrane protein YckC